MTGVPATCRQQRVRRRYRSASLFLPAGSPSAAPANSAAASDEEIERVSRPESSGPQMEGTCVLYRLQWRMSSDVNDDLSHKDFVIVHG